MSYISCNGLYQENTPGCTVLLFTNLLGLHTGYFIVWILPSIIEQNKRIILKSWTSGLLNRHEVCEVFIYVTPMKAKDKCA